MDRQLLQLVNEVAELTGAAPPSLLADDAPVPDTRAAPFYCVGIIGGKDVGKSALINAIVQENITAETSYGPGTQHVIAYAHCRQEAPVRELLEREAPGQHAIVLHEIRALESQVLLDLPDIDSHWESHSKLTTRMLRFMLYPIWMQSIEKYADRQVQEMLRRVALGNSPTNFLFCLNKVDHLKEDQAAIDELRNDYAARVAASLGLDEQPQVYAISAIHPERYDLPQLRKVLSQQKDARQVQTDRRQAARRQASTLVGWLQDRQLGQQRDRLMRIEQQADEALRDRVAGLIRMQPEFDLTSDRLEMIDRSLSARIKRWPLVGILHATLWPILTLVRSNLRPVIAAVDDRDQAAAVADAVRAVFAQMYQTQPEIAALYPGRQLWEGLPAQSAASRLIHQLTESVGRWREEVIMQASKGMGFVWPLRWAIVLGIPFWFLAVVPVLTVIDAGNPLMAAIHTFNVAFVLQIVTLTLLWLAVVWATLRWRTQRKVDRIIQAKGGAVGVSPEAVLLEWIDDMTSPLQQRRERLDDLLRRIADAGERANSAEE